jgi:hypothetical protein
MKREKIDKVLLLSPARLQKKYKKLQQQMLLLLLQFYEE